jgi:5-oxoprolinase (ATP-hydrolysing) subunit A
VRVDLNADLGESVSAAELAGELSLAGLVTSVNVACGAHAGNAATMRRVLEAARAAGSAVGAHPGYPDREGRGRRALHLAPSVVTTLVADQIATLSEVAASVGVTVVHVKPHGALYNQAARDPELALAIAAAVVQMGSGLRLVGLADSELIGAGRRLGLPVAAEAFLDRRYRPDGTLVPRGEPGAIIDSATDATAQAVSIVVEGGVRATDGAWLPIAADTICIHGDTAGAPVLARRVRAALEAAGVEVRPLR